MLDVGDGVARRERAGFGEVRQPDRMWNPPLRLIVGERA